MSYRHSAIEMGFGHQSSFKGALVVQPSSEQSLPIPVAEASILEIVWSADGSTDIIFSASFTGDTPGSPASELVPAGHHEEAQEGIKLEIGQPGRCMLLFKNCSGGFFGGSARKVTYTATMHTKKEIDAIAEKERLEKERAAAEERFKAACEKERHRRHSAEHKIHAMFKTVTSKQHEASELLSSAWRKDEEVHALRRKIEELEKASKEEMERCGSLADEAAQENELATTLRQDNFHIAKGWPITLQVSMIRATGLKALNFTGDNPWCQCDVKHHHNSDYEHNKDEVHTAATEVAPNTLDPVWNETHQIDWHMGDRLEFQVFDKGTLISKQEGKPSILASNRFFPDGFEGDLHIRDLEDAILHVRVVPMVDKHMPPVDDPHWPITTATWSTQQVHDLGRDENAFKHKAQLLAGYKSPTAAVEALNAANIDIPKKVFDDGYCVLLQWEKTVRSHLLLYRSDGMRAAAKQFSIDLVAECTR